MSLRFPILFSIIFATSPVIHANQADLNAKVTVSDSTIHTGEWFTVTGTVKNEGPDDARNVYAFVAFIYQPLFSNVVASGDWSCTRFGECSTPVLKSGAVVTVTLRVLSYNALNRTPWLPSPVMTGAFNVVQSVKEPDYSNNHASFTITLLESAAHAGLSVGLIPDRNPAPNDEPTTVFVNVRNGGPDPAPNVEVRFGEETTTNSPASELSGDGWQCDLALLRCSRPVLSAGQTTTIALRIFAQHNKAISISVEIAAEHITDSNYDDNHASTVQSFGDAADYERVLVPI